jgi:hypothetical protein
MKGINLLPALSTKSDVLLDAVGMENINPEYRVVGAGIPRHPSPGVEKSWSE